MGRNVRAIVAGLIFALGMHAAAGAVGPENLSYQGVLRLNDGRVVANGSYNLRFRIYDAAAVGNVRFEQGLAVTVTDGLYNVILSNTSLKTALNTSMPLFMEVAIVAPFPPGSGITSDAVFGPRQQISSAPYALFASPPSAADVSVSPPVAGMTSVQTALAAVATSQSSILVGQLEYLSVSSVVLRRGPRSLVVADIDGAVLTSNSDITFELPTHLSGSPEASNTWYYLYIENSSGTLTPRISATAPVLASTAQPGEKIGYHPTSTTWRHVGTVQNDASYNVRPFTAYREGLGWAYLLWNGFGPFTKGTASSITYSALAVQTAFPTTARVGRFRLHINAGDDVFLFLGHGSKVNTTADALNAILMADGATLSAFSLHNMVDGWCPLDANRQVAYAQIAASFNGAPEIYVHGFME